MLEDGSEYAYDKAQGMAWDMMSEQQKNQYNLVKAFIEDPESAALEEIEKLLDDEQKVKFQQIKKSAKYFDDAKFDQEVG